MVFESDKASDAFLVLGICSVSGGLIICTFLLFIYVPKIRSLINDLLDIIVQNWSELQLMTAFAYFEINYTVRANEILRSNRRWAFFNFFDQYCDNVTGENPEDFLYTEWSENAFKNVFTILLFLGIYILAYGIYKILGKCRPSLNLVGLTKFFEFEIVLQILKLGTFRISFSLFIEIYRLAAGSSSSYGTAIISILSFFILLLYPILKLMYLRLKYRGNLEGSLAFEYFGSDFRAYQYCWREFHLLVDQSLMLITGACIVFLKYFEEIQVLMVLACHAIFFGYTTFFHPFKKKLRHIEAVCSRFCLLSISTIVAVRYYYKENRFFEDWIIAVLSVWYAGKVGFLVLHLKNTFQGVRGLLDKSLPAEIAQGKLLKENSNMESKDMRSEDRLGHTNDQGAFSSEKLDKDDTSNITENPLEKKRIRRSIAAENVPDNIDPRLSRKRTSRKRKTVFAKLDPEN
ncbi:hypothetical protein SteCoe_822 [Stentor coeruleus]|uniref:TRP C-terminal domain-containing protein n=1 Tax=Stentor coeruleus TaxID=5963 RepID=A0A1R2D3B5_9CILI|nr:hypothetical protein SteCoe_822 [Stentor coeruleus]